MVEFLFIFEEIGGGREVWLAGVGKKEWVDGW